MHRKRSYYSVLGCALIALVSCHYQAARDDETPISADRIVNIDNGPVHVPLGKYLNYLEDPGGELTIDQVRPRVAEFKPSTDKVLNFGLTESAVWVRFQLRNTSDSPRELLIDYAYPAMDSVELFQELDGKIVSGRYGDLLPHSARPIRHRNLLLPIEIKAGASRTFFMRFKTLSVMDIPLFLWSPEEMRRKDRDEQLILGVFYGILGVMFFYNFFLFVAVRRISFLYYVLYILTVGLLEFSFNGLAYEYLWPEWVGLNDRIIPVLACLAMSSIIHFTRSLLEYHYDESPRIVILLMIYTGTLLLLAVAISVAPLPGLNVIMIYRIGFITILTTGALVFLLGLRRLAQGNRPARYFILAWTIFLISMMGHSLKNLGYLPSLFITNYSMQIAISIEVVVFSFALGDYINAIKQQQSEIQSRYLQTRQVAVEQAALLDQANLKALQERMDPHFLFNSLNMIYSLLAMGKSNKASEAVITLAENYSFLVENTSNLVPFETEWEFMTNYCRLAEMRFHGKIRIHTSRSGNLRRAKIPPITLQPFIENSIKHGFRDSQGVGTILARAEPHRDGARLIFMDSGRGLETFNDSRSIANIRERLEFYYEEVLIEARHRRRGGASFDLRFSGFKRDKEHD